MMPPSQKTPRASSAATLFSTPVTIGLRADHNHKLGILGSQVLLAPTRPAWRRPDVILVKFGIDAHLAKFVRQGEDAVRMLGRVVAIANKDGVSAHGLVPVPPRCDDARRRS